jgi:hypothetical protein
MNLRANRKRLIVHPRNAEITTASSENTGFLIEDFRLVGTRPEG